MTTPQLTPTFVQETLRMLAGLEIDAEEAGRLLPMIQAQRDALATLDQFDVCEVRSSLSFDPTSPYRVMTEAPAVS
jgi:hypothetical protein